MALLSCIHARLGQMLMARPGFIDPWGVWRCAPRVVWGRLLRHTRVGKRTGRERERARSITVFGRTVSVRHTLCSATQHYSLPTPLLDDDKTLLSDTLYLYEVVDTTRVHGISDVRRGE